MKRGDIWLINFDPSIGGEIQKTRPGIIISNNISNKYLNRVQVIPVSSQINKLYPSECYLFVSRKKAKAMADQIMTVSKKRLIKYMGKISDNDLSNLEKIIKIQLDIGIG